MKIIIIIASLLLAVAAPVFGHVRWFVENEPPAIAWPVDSILFLLLAGSLFYVGALIGPFHRFDRFRAMPHWADWLIRGSLAITFLSSSSMGVWLAPNLSATPMLLDVQQVVGILLLANRRLGILALTIACGLAIFTSYFSLLIDYVFELVGVTLALAVWKQKPQLALFFLRTSLGLQLMTLAVHNKMINPALGIQFLLQHPYNFMDYFLSNFSDLHFVLAAGFAEFCFGLMFVLNKSVRVNGLIVCFFFSLTSVLMGLHELVGHLPIIMILIVLLVWGGGSSLPDLKRQLIMVWENMNRSAATLTKNIG